MATSKDATKETATQAVPITGSMHGWPDVAIGANAAESSVEGMRRIPLAGLTTMGNQDPSRDSATLESAAARAIVLIPEDLDEGKPIDVLLHLHGHNIGYRQRKIQGTVRDVTVDRFESQVKASGRQMIVVLPQGTTLSGFGRHGLNADAYLTNVWESLVATGAMTRTPSVVRTVVSGHSGAGFPLTEMLRGIKDARLPSNLGAMLLFDAINGDNECAAVQAWILRELDGALANLGKGGRSPLFRAVHTKSKHYLPVHRKLSAALDAWFQRFADALGGMNSPVYVQWRAACRVVPVTHGDHDGIVGRSDGLLQALRDLPQ